MLVDNAIVIVENIYRHMQLGHSRVEAAIIGTREVAWPVTTSTLTNIAAFLPLMFWPGIMGDFMKYLPITCPSVVLASLFVALVFNPTFCSVLAGRAASRARPRSTGSSGATAASSSAGLDNPGMALFLSVCLLVGLAILYGKIGQGVEFFPQGDPERAIINVRLPQGTNIRETDRIVRLIEHRIEPYKPWLKHVVTNVGSSSGGMDLIATAGGPHLANITPGLLRLCRAKAALHGDHRRRFGETLPTSPARRSRSSRRRHGPPTGCRR